MNKLELAIEQNKGVNFYSESYPDYTAIDGAMTMDINDTQAAHFLALYNDSNQRWVGYNALALEALGLNPDLAGDNPETLDNIFLDSVPQPVIDQTKVDMFTTMINARNNELTKLEGQPDVALGIADRLVDQYITQQQPAVSLPSDVGPSIQGTDTSTPTTTSTDSPTDTTDTTPTDTQT